jgi:hypothetical protein
MKFKLDENSLNDAAQRFYTTVMQVQKSLNEMGLPGEDSMRAMIVTAYKRGAIETVERINESDTQSPDAKDEG